MEPRTAVFIYPGFRNRREVITDRIGIREISVKDAVLYINGTAIKFKGVNRHDSIR